MKVIGGNVKMETRLFGITAYTDYYCEKCDTKLRAEPKYCCNCGVKFNWSLLNNELVKEIYKRKKK